MRTIQMQGVPETMLQTLYARAAYSERKGAKLRDDKAVEIVSRMDYERYLSETRMLDYSNEKIQRLIAFKGWRQQSEIERLKSIYNFVRDEILFGYNVDDSIPASKVLSDGYGQCNTKGTLFMALLRACGIPCRVHGFTIDKTLQKGAMTGLVYKNAPKNVFHSWVEAFCGDTWYELEGFILDKDYLNRLQQLHSECNGAFCGYGAAVKDFKNPVIDFNGNNTYIQSEGINQDFGIYDSPDELLKEHHQEMSALKAFAYKNLGRHLMNRNVKKIRNKKF
ncbi:MAG: transglutaminase [Bacteroides sp.]|nr:transglutaminase [Bacteroides sp.]